MTVPAVERRDRLRGMLADLKMPGALEAVDGILTQADSGAVSAAEAIEQLLNAQIGLRNNRRLQAAMRSSRLPAVKTLAQFDFSFQPSIKREQIESLHGCLRCLLLVMCTHPFAKEALTLHLASSEGHERFWL